MAPKYPLDTLVWAQVSGYPWWPAQVVPYSAYYFLPQDKPAPKRNNNNTTVKFFGDGSLSYLSPTKVVLFKDHEKYRKKKGKWAKRIEYAMLMAEKRAEELSSQTIPDIPGAVILNGTCEVVPVEENQVSPAQNLGGGGAPVRSAASAPFSRHSTRRSVSPHGTGSASAMQGGSDGANSPVVAVADTNNAGAGGVMTASQHSSLGVSNKPISKPRRSPRGNASVSTPSFSAIPPSTGAISVQRCENDTGADSAMNNGGTASVVYSANH